MPSWNGSWQVHMASTMWLFVNAQQLSTLGFYTMSSRRVVSTCRAAEWEVIDGYVWRALNVKKETSIGVVHPGWWMCAQESFPLIFHLIRYVASKPYNNPREGGESPKHLMSHMSRMASSLNKMVILNIKYFDTSISQHGLYIQLVNFSLVLWGKTTTCCSSTRFSLSIL